MTLFFGTAPATYGIALLISAVLNNITTRAIFGSIFVVLGFIPACGSALADSIEAEEIEVPAPEWSVFYEEPDPPVLVDYAPMPPGIKESGPPVVPPPPFSPCWLPFVSCGGGDGGPPRIVLPGPPGGPPSAPVPEPTAALLFAVGLGAIAKGARR